MSSFQLLLLSHSSSFLCQTSRIPAASKHVDEELRNVIDVGIEEGGSKRKFFESLEIAFIIVIVFVVLYMCLICDATVNRVLWSKVNGHQTHKHCHHHTIFAITTKDE